MSVPTIILNTQVLRERRTQTGYNSLGERNETWTATQSILARIIPLDGMSPKFQSEGRISESSHRLICNLIQYTAAANPAYPFQEVASLTDVKMGDRIRDAGNVTYRVDWVEDVENEHDHIECRMTRFDPGNEDKQPI